MLAHHCTLRLGPLLWTGVLLLLLLVTRGAAAGSGDDDFTPTDYSPAADVKLANKYPHLGTSLQTQDNTFLSNDETKEDYGISLIVFPALVAGICLICVCCFCCCLCFRCFFLGCFNCFKCIFRLCIKDCCRKSKEKKAAQLETREKRYAIYSKIFPFLLVCSLMAIIWVWEGAYYMDEGVKETKRAMIYFGEITESITDELTSMSESGRRIESFLSSNTCPSYVSSYLEDIGDSFSEFSNSTSQIAKMTASVQPAMDTASKQLEAYWNDFQEVAFDLSAGVLLVVMLVYALGVCMKTAILMRLGLLLTILLSFVLCVLVFVEMVVVMGYSDFCMEPTHHMERSLKGEEGQHYPAGMHAYIMGAMENIYDITYYIHV
jgi:hypothetical protein